MAVKDQLDYFKVNSGLGFHGSEISMYEFGGRRSFDDAKYFLSQRQLVKTVRPLLNSSHQRHILEDKWVAAHYAAGVDLPSPRTLCLWRGDSGVSFAGYKLKDALQLEAELRDRGCPELAIKPRGGRQGRALIIARVVRDGPRLLLRIDNSTLTLPEFIQRLKKDDFQDYGGGYHGWLIQERLEQSAIIEAINPDTLNTIRVVTVNSRDAGPRFVAAAMRIGRSGAIVDSWALGGLSVGVDLKTGILGQAVSKPKHGGNWTASHPDSGEQIEGRKVPHWESCLDIAREAALAYSGVGTVGWDIAVTPKGAVLVEGNADWSLPLIQIHTDGLLRSVLAEEVLNRGGDLTFKKPTIPGIYTKKVKMRTKSLLHRILPG